VIFRLGAKAEAAGDFADLEAAVAVGVVGDELVEERAEVVAELAGGEFLLGGEGFGGGTGCRRFGAFGRLLGRVRFGLVGKDGFGVERVGVEDGFGGAESCVGVGVLAGRFFIFVC